MSRARALALALTGVLAGVLGGCSDADDVLTKEQAAAVLLTSEDVPLGFQQGTDADPGDGRLGCLTATDQLEDLDPARTDESSFLLNTAVQGAGVFSAVNSYDSASTITDGFESFRDDLAGCESVDVIQAGVHTQLQVEVDDAVGVEGADEQITLDAEGTISSDGTAVPYYVRFSITRVDNNLTLVAAYELGRLAGDNAVVKDLATYNATVVQRLLEIQR